MDSLIIPAKEATPYVKFDVEHRKLVIKGDSYDDEVFLVYDLLQKKLIEYIEAGNLDLDVNLYFEYYNTSSSKCLYEMFDAFKMLQSTNGSSLSIIWNYSEGDEQMKDDLEEFRDFVGIDFSIVETPEDD